MLQEASGGAGHPSYRRYHYGTGPLLVEDGGTRRFISTDALGSTTDLTTTGGSVSSMRKYDAWGQYRNDTAPAASEPKLGFTGHQYDPETGLVYARARYYDPDLGRFLSRDTVEGTLSDAPSLHRYTYGQNNPLTYIDEDGRSATAVGTALGAAWGTGQAIGGLIGLGLEKLTGGAVVSNVHSIGDALGLVAQNTIGGFELGLSLDMAAVSGGMAVAAGSGALGFAGADALTLQGKARSASDFAISQVVEGGKGAAVGVGLGVVAKGLGVVAKTTVGEFVVREAVEAVGAVAKTSAGRAVTGAAHATAARVVPALRALGAEADEAAVDVGLGWMPNAGKSLAGKLNAAEAVVNQEVAAAWREATTSWTGPAPVPSGTPLGQPPSSHGVFFFGDDVLPYYTRAGATLGRPGGSTFFMSLEDAGVVRNAADAARYSGMAPSAAKAYVTGGDVHGMSFPLGGRNIRMPTAGDAGGFEHFVEGGRTAVRGEGPNAGFLMNETREFVTPGGGPVPSESVLFTVGPNGEWIPVRRY